MHSDLLGRGNSSIPRDGTSYKERCVLQLLTGLFLATQPLETSFVLATPLHSLINIHTTYICIYILFRNHYIPFI